MKYDTNKDFYPVAFITSAPDGLTVQAESTYKNLNDRIDAAKKNPNKLSYGTAGTGVAATSFPDPFPGHRHQDQTRSLQRRWRIHTGAPGRASRFRHLDCNRDSAARKAQASSGP